MFSKATQGKEKKYTNKQKPHKQQHTSSLKQTNKQTKSIYFILYTDFKTHLLNTSWKWKRNKSCTYFVWPEFSIRC